MNLMKSTAEFLTPLLVATAVTVPMAGLAEAQTIPSEEYTSGIVMPYAETPQDERARVVPAEGRIYLGQLVGLLTCLEHSGIGVRDMVVGGFSSEDGPVANNLAIARQRALSVGG